MLDATPISCPHTGYSGLMDGRPGGNVAAPHQLQRDVSRMNEHKLALVTLQERCWSFVSGKVGAVSRPLSLLLDGNRWIHPEMWSNAPDPVRERSGGELDLSRGTGLSGGCDTVAAVLEAFDRFSGRGSLDVLAYGATFDPEFPFCAPYRDATRESGGKFLVSRRLDGTAIGPEDLRFLDFMTSDQDWILLLRDDNHDAGPRLLMTPVHDGEFVLVAVADPAATTGFA